jgi:hypothetical protein
VCSKHYTLACNVKAGDFLDLTVAGRIESESKMPTAAAMKPAFDFEPDCNAADATALPTNPA